MMTPKSPEQLQNSVDAYNQKRRDQTAKAVAKLRTAHNPGHHVETGAHSGAIVSHNPKDGKEHNHPKTFYRPFEAPGGGTSGTGKFAALSRSMLPEHVAARAAQQNHAQHAVQPSPAVHPHEHLGDHPTYGAVRRGPKGGQYVEHNGRKYYGNYIGGK